MIAIEQITVGNVALFRETRLRALRDTPTAFGATYAEESQFSRAEWLARVARRIGDSGIGFLAMGHPTQFPLQFPRNFSPQLFLDMLGFSFHTVPIDSQWMERQWKCPISCQAPWTCWF